MNYSIEVNYSYDGLTDIEKDVKSAEIKLEISKIAKDNNGEISGFDEDIGFGPKGLIKKGINYNWEFKVVEDAITFLNNLPSIYNILWIYKRINSDSIIIYSLRNKPEVNKFTDNDKELYKNIIARLKK